MLVTFLGERPSGALAECGPILLQSVPAMFQRIRSVSRVVRYLKSVIGVRIQTLNRIVALIRPVQKKDQIYFYPLWILRKSLETRIRSIRDL
jgi:predicted transcriptional regulator